MNPQVYRSGLAPRLPSMVAVCLTGTWIFVYPSTSGPAISASQFAPSSLNTDIVNYGLWLSPEDHEKTVWSKSPIVRIPDIPHCWSPCRRDGEGACLGTRRRANRSVDRPESVIG